MVMRFGLKENLVKIKRLLIFGWLISYIIFLKKVLINYVMVMVFGLIDIVCVVFMYRYLIMWM